MDFYNIPKYGKNNNFDKTYSVKQTSFYIYMIQSVSSDTRMRTKNYRAYRKDTVFFFFKLRIKFLFT